MTKPPEEISAIKTPDFVKNIEEALSSPIHNSQDIASLAGNSLEMSNDGVEKPDSEKLIEKCELNGWSLLRGAAKIFGQNFYQFLKTNLILSGILFGIMTFLPIKFSVDIFSDPSFLTLHNPIWISNLLIFWIVFIWLRCAYLTIASNYFSVENSNPLLFGFKKILSFALIELLQMLLLLIGLIILPLLPVFVGKYFLSKAVMINQDGRAINAMFESREYVRKQIKMVIAPIFFIGFFTVAAIGSCFLISNFLIENISIFWVTNFFLISLVFLPLHGCYRMLIYKKLEHFTGEFRFEISLSRKIWFVSSRLVFLGLLVANLFLIVNGAFSEAVAKASTLIGEIYEKF